MQPRVRSQRRVLPGFGLGMGITLFWLGLIVLIPLLGVFLKAAGLGLGGIWQIWTEPRVLA
ncbi:MAG: molybdate ABC transporter permease subunit, partial [Stenotrophomonas sp.]